jgi:hypothetical protein
VCEGVGIGGLHYAAHIMAHARIKQYGAGKYAVTFAIDTFKTGHPAAGWGAQQLFVAVYGILEMPK